MVLRALEQEYWRRDPKALPIVQFDWPSMQIEHVMPQSWQETWRLPRGAEARIRDIAVQTIGNLTLISAPLNPSISNGSWAGKRKAFAKHAQQLHLNRSLIEAEKWDEAVIAARSKTLFELAQAVWPRPAS